MLSQHGAHHLLRPSTDGLSPTLRLKPDLQIVHGKQPLMILDTKWKLHDNKPLDPSDAYQMLAYGHGLGCRRLVLIFPRASGNPERIDYEYNTLADKPVQLQLRYVDLQDAARACSALVDEIDEILTVDTANT
nr:McrC family protein [Aromatoleum evansii]